MVSTIAVANIRAENGFMAVDPAIIKELAPGAKTLNPASKNKATKITILNLEFPGGPVLVTS